MGTAPENSVAARFAHQFGVPPGKVAARETAIRPWYPGDDMLVELRLLRTLSAVRDGLLTLDEAIAEFGRGKSVA